MKKYLILFFFVFVGQICANDLLPAKGKTIVMPNAIRDADNLDVFQKVTGYVPTGHRFWITLDDDARNYLQKHIEMKPYNGSFMITLLFGHARDGDNGLSTQEKLLPKILNGSLDEKIDELAKELKACNVPIYLDIGNEAEFFYPRQSGDFVKAFRYVQTKLKPKCPKVVFFWHSVTDHGFAPRWQDWYPGDEFVDGIAVSLYNDAQFRSAERLAKFAKDRRKAFAIFEFGLAPHEASAVTGGRVWDWSWKGYHERLFRFVELYDVPLVGYVGYADDISFGGPFHNSRIDYLDNNIQKGWANTLKRSRYKK